MPSNFTAPEIRRLPDLLLAMKPVASRNRDIPDIKLLAEAIGRKDPVALANLVRDQYGEDQLEALHGGYEDMLIWCRTLSGQLWPRAQSVS